MDSIRLRLCIIASFVGTSHSDIPRSHTRVLEEILSKHVDYSSVYKWSMTDIILGRKSGRNINIDYAVLDQASLSNILDKAKETYFDKYILSRVNSSQHSHRRQWYKDWWNKVYTAVSNEVINLWNGVTDAWNYMFGPKPASYSYFHDDPTDLYDKYPEQSLTNRSLMLMRQSIFAVRYRLQNINQVIKVYERDPSYIIGTIVSNVHQLVLKCQNLFAQATEFPEKTHFIWPLIIYEKILAADTDVTDLVMRAFHYHAEYLKNVV